MLKLQDFQSYDLPQQLFIFILIQLIKLRSFMHITKLLLIKLVFLDY